VAADLDDTPTAPIPSDLHKGSIESARQRFGDCGSNGSVALSVVTVCDLTRGGCGSRVKSARPYIRLFDHLGLGVDFLGAPVVVREGECGGGGVDVQVEAAGE